MLRNYFKIATRNLLKNKLFSFINIAGLTIGATCFLLILLYVYSQFQYDTHHEAKNSLYRVETNLLSNEDEFISATVSPPIVPVMQNDFPEIVNSTRVVGEMESTKYIFKWKNTSFYETKGYYVDSTFFSMFDYAWLEGTPENAVQDPFTIVLTKEVKEKLFGRQPALGEIIEINSNSGSNQFKVTGVVDQSVYKSHIRANFYLSMRSGGLGEYVRTNQIWSGSNFIYGYIELHPSAKPEDLVNKLPAFLQKHGGDQLAEAGMKKTLSLQAVRDIHLHSLRNNQLDVTGNYRFLKILLLIAAFILLIACVNFMNLSTAKSLKRGVEVGIRKTIGANRRSIAKQFYVESFLVAGISFVLAIVITLLLIQPAASFVSDQFHLNLPHSPIIGLVVLVIYILIALIAGSYPALYLSSFKPVAVIKGFFKKGKGQDKIRKSLVVMQFAISISMIIGSIIILNQLKYMKNKDLGFDQKQKIVIPFNTEAAREKLSAFKTQVKNLSAVKNAASAVTHPGQFMMRDFGLFKDGSDVNNSHNVKLILGDEDYIPTLGIQILHGRNFTARDTNETRMVLVNQTALKAFGIPESEALGEKLVTEYNNRRTLFEIIGVVRDYHQRTLKEPIRSMMFEYRRPLYNLHLLVNATTSENSNLIADLEKAWNTTIPDTPFEYHFLDEQFEAQYKDDVQMATLINLFTFIAIFISCLGLFGLSVFIAEQRTKEIGIRKVLGASTAGLVMLLSKGFIKLIFLALIIAIPLAWYFMDGWLEGFAYRIDVQWWVFILTGVIALGVGLLTVGFNSLKAALANPVESIKTE